MSRTDLTFDADESDETVTVEVAERDAAYRLRNHVFAGYFDGQYPTTYGEELRDAIPEPKESVESLSFVVSADDAIGIAQAMEYGAAVATRDDRDATARRMESEADRFRDAARDALNYDRA